MPYRGAPVWLGERTRPDREAGPAPAGPGLPRRPGLPPGPGAPRREAALPGPGAVEREPALADVSEFEEALAALPLAREIRLDRRNRVVWVRGAARQLTAKEFALLDHLAKAQSRAGAVSRAELVKAVWAGSPVGQATRTVDIHVGRVRQKLGIAELIVTARGRGYFMNPRWRVRA
ncbi:MAG: winged helix-turn-helix domain-containing protein [Bifidobacteriaceae bacterium]|nr:winged helix-turn-helix domain-containing protein [Bifidobacteriaceae bacterium]